MARRRAAREGLDDDHAAAATWTCRLVVIRSIGIGRFALRLWPSEQFADARDVVGAGGLGQLPPLPRVPRLEIKAWVAILPRARNDAKPLQ